MFEIDINDYGYDCEGVGRREDGKVCFVPYTIKGERVLAKEIEEEKSFVRCKCEEVKKKSDKRVKPLCPYFEVCGGCNLQHVCYDEELLIKKEVLSKQLCKAGYKGEIKVERSENEYFYRNKIKLFRAEKGLGLKKPASNEVVVIEDCVIAEKDLGRAIKGVQTFVRAQNLLGQLKEVTLKCQGDDVLVWFNFEKDVKVSFQGLQIMLGYGSGIFVSVGNDIPHKVLGAENLTFKENGIDAKMKVNSFRQVNTPVADKLYDLVLKNIKVGDVVNAYSGAGLLTGMIAKKNRCYGIEIGVAEHNDAERLKRDNSLGKMFNFLGDVGRVLPKVLSKNIKTVVLDPPRKGCDKRVCEILDNSGVERIIYISCDSATLTRDLQRLKNYKISSATLFDMFPKTSNMETLVVLDKITLKKLPIKKEK